MTGSVGLDQGKRICIEKPTNAARAAGYQIKDNTHTLRTWSSVCRLRLCLQLWGWLSFTSMFESLCQAGYGENETEEPQFDGKPPVGIGKRIFVYTRASCSVAAAPPLPWPFGPDSK